MFKYSRIVIAYDNTLFQRPLSQKDNRLAPLLLFTGKLGQPASASWRFDDASRIISCRLQVLQTGVCAKGTVGVEACWQVNVRQACVANLRALFHYVDHQAGARPGKHETLMLQFCGDRCCNSRSLLLPTRSFDPVQQPCRFWQQMAPAGFLFLLLGSSR